MLNIDSNAEALQKTIELLSEIQGLDQLVPRVLDIVADITDSKSCAFFENSDYGKIWLRYWHSDGISYLPDDLLELDPEKFALVRHLAEGFEAPDEYLGMQSTQVGSVQLDHFEGTCVPEFDKFAVETGWDLELNVGVGVGGKRDMTLCIYRSRSKPFTQNEISFVESIAKQIRLAWRLARAADDSKRAALALERESEMRSRAAFIEKINLTVQQCVDRMANAKNAREAIAETLIAISEALQPIGANDIGLTEYWPVQDSIRCTTFVRDGILTDISSVPVGQVWPVSHSTMVKPWQRIQTEDFIWGLKSDESVLIPEVSGYYQNREAKSIAYVPTRCGTHITGFIGCSLVTEQPPSFEIIGFLKTLANHVALVVEMERVGLIAEEVQKSRLNEDIANARVEAEVKRSQELEAAYEQSRKEAEQRANAERIVRGHAHVINESLTRLSREPKPSQHLAIVLESLVGTLGIDSAVVFLHDKSTDRSIYEIEYRSGTVITEFEKSERQIKTSLTRDWDDFFLSDLKAGKILHHGENDLQTHPAYEPYRTRIQARKVREMLIAPLFSGEEYLGFLALRSTESGYFLAIDRGFVRSMANQVALAVKMLKLFSIGEQAAVMEERNRISRDLHDSLAQGFTGVILNLEVALQALGKNRPEIASNHIQSACKAARSGLANARESVLALRTPLSLGIPFETALLDCVTNLLVGSQILINFETIGTPYAVPYNIREEFLKVVQEATTNTIRHAKASRVNLTIIYAEEFLLINFSDDGQGFDERNTQPGLGIKGMYERSYALGCDLIVTSQIGKGTRVGLRCPRPSDLPGDRASDRPNDRPQQSS